MHLPTLDLFELENALVFPARQTIYIVNVFTNIYEKLQPFRFKNSKSQKLHGV